MLTRCRVRPSTRGFTLIELLITVAIVSMLAAIGLVGYLRYINSAQSAEARAVFGQIRHGEESYRVEELQYLSCSSSLTDYYPNASPNNTRWAWQRSTDTRYNNTTNGWAMLNVNPDGPVRYGYAVYAGISPGTPPAIDTAWATGTPIFAALASGTPWFVIEAKNVHFPNGPPNLLLTTSYDGTILTYNEGN